MSLYGALITGVAGLDANSTALSVASANIANVNTVGYKNATAQFSTFLASSMGASDPSSAGVVANSNQNVTTQGLLQTTTSPTDLAISGNGFFVVSPTSDTSTLEYTRAGNFTTDAQGNLVNAAGLHLLGWALDSAGNPPTDPSQLTQINVAGLAGKAEATTTATLQANLQSSATVDGSYTAGDMASGAATPDFQRTINVYDSQGGSQPIQLSFIKTAANTWAYEASYQGPAGNITGTNPIASGTMTFNADGSLANADTSASPPTGNISITIPWSATSGLTSQAISFNMGTVGGTNGFTQFDNTSALTNSNVNGAVFGSVSGLSIAADGTVSAQFSNGLSQNVFKLPLATFSNPDGLAEVSGNAYTVTPNSGSPTINGASTGGAGSIQADALEGSTVDIASEFTNLITTQRAYSASARIVTTADQMLQTLEQIQ
ncbi:MAG TPA: flagellar hook protein FlgE [Rhizomicrobium sp.]